MGGQDHVTLFYRTDGILKITMVRPKGDLLVDVTRFSEEEWRSIQKLAQAMYNDKHFSGNQLRCAISAFVIWLSQQAIIQEELEPDSKLVH